MEESKGFGSVAIMTVAKEPSSCLYIRPGRLYSQDKATDGREDRCRYEAHPCNYFSEKSTRNSRGKADTSRSESTVTNAPRIYISLSVYVKWLNYSYSIVCSEP